MRVLLVTESFPWSDAHEESFLDPEMRSLSTYAPFVDNDVHVVLAPLTTHGERVGVVPKGATVTTVVADAVALHHARRRAAKAADVHLLRELPRRAVDRQALTPLSADLHSIAYWASLRSGTAAGVSAWLRTSADDGPLVAVTYWFNGATSGVLDVRDETRRFRSVVTRAHRHDLFPEHSWHPRRRSDLGKLDATYSVSQAGAAQLRRDGGAADRVHVRRLGVEALDGAPTRNPRPDWHREMRILSCSYATSVKRVPLIGKVLGEAARLSAGDVVWEHFGDGPDLAEVREVISQAPPNLRVVLHGDVANLTVRRRAREGGFHAFVNLSSSEGLPVTLMEAAEAGIAMLATDVGGSAEIVTPSSGRLVGAADSTQQIVAALMDVVANAADLGAGAHELWRRSFNAEANHHAFYDSLRRLCGETP